MLYLAIGIVLGLLLLVPLFLLAALSAMSSKPENLGVRDGRLAPCPSSPNCVSSQAEDQQHGMEPIVFSGSAEDALRTLKTILTRMPRVSIVTEQERYLHAEATSAVFRFVDDIEFLVDERHKTIHFRSASRAGHSDLGVNRSRMEKIRTAFQRAVTAK